MEIYYFSDYKKFVLQRLSAMPNRGRGALTKMSAAIGIHTSLTTHIFKGDKDLSHEQAFLVSEFLELDFSEKEYFLTLVGLQRASRQNYKAFLSLKLEALRKKATGKSAGTQRSSEFTNQERQIFYSQWYYAAIHLFTTIPGYDSVEKISAATSLPPAVVKNALDFLVSINLCSNMNGRFSANQMTTEIKGNPSLSISHNTNWRYKAIERLSIQAKSDHFYNNLISLSEKDVAKVREIVEKFKAEIMAIAVASPPEVIYCLNIDWCRI